MKAVMSLLLILISSVNPDQRVTGLKDIDDYHVIMKILDVTLIAYNLKDETLPNSCYPLEPRETTSQRARTVDCLRPIERAQHQRGGQDAHHHHQHQDCHQHQHQHQHRINQHE